MSNDDIVGRVADHARKTLDGEGSGHDWWHTYRVWRLAKRIAEAEGADRFVVALAALLHDIDDWKLSGDALSGARAARAFLEGIGGVESETIERVCDIISKMSFKGALVEVPELSMEGKCVQDADRLDAIGAIGIARVFTYGGSRKRPIFDPKTKPKMHSSPDEYLKGGGSSVDHFYEKLLLLKDRMNTKTGKRLALVRHQFMERFLEEFMGEWNDS